MIIKATLIFVMTFSLSDDRQPAVYSFATERVKRRAMKIPPEKAGIVRPSDPTSPA